MVNFTNILLKGFGDPVAVAVSFKYSPKLVGIVKSLPAQSRKWDPAGKRWLIKPDEKSKLQTKLIDEGIQFSSDKEVDPNFQSPWDEGVFITKDGDFLEFKGPYDPTFLASFKKFFKGQKPQWMKWSKSWRIPYSKSNLKMLKYLATRLYDVKPTVKA